MTTWSSSYDTVLLRYGGLDANFCRVLAFFKKKKAGPLFRIIVRNLYLAPLGTGCWQTEHDINALSAVLMPLACTWPFSGHWHCCGSTDKTADIQATRESQNPPQRAPLRSGRVVPSKYKLPYNSFKRSLSKLFT